MPTKAKVQQSLDIEQVVFDKGRVSELTLCDREDQSLIEIGVYYMNRDEISLSPISKITLRHQGKLLRLIADYNKLGKRSIGL